MTLPWTYFCLYFLNLKKIEIAEWLWADKTRKRKDATRRWTENEYFFVNDFMIFPILLNDYRQTNRLDLIMFLGM